MAVWYLASEFRGPVVIRWLQADIKRGVWWELGILSCWFCVGVVRLVVIPVYPRATEEVPDSYRSLSLHLKNEFLPSEWRKNHLELAYCGGGDHRYRANPSSLGLNFCCHRARMVHRSIIFLTTTRLDLLCQSYNLPCHHITK